MARSKSYYEEARARAKRVKNPWNLLYLPLNVVGVGSCMWGVLKIVQFVGGLLGLRHIDFRYLAKVDGGPGILIVLGFFLPRCPSD
jgi:hypothetical protein